MAEHSPEYETIRVLHAEIARLREANAELLAACEAVREIRLVAWTNHGAHDHQARILKKYAGGKSYRDVDDMVAAAIAKARAAGEQRG